MNLQNDLDCKCLLGKKLYVYSVCLSGSFMMFIDGVTYTVFYMSCFMFVCACRNMPSCKY